MRLTRRVHSQKCRLKNIALSPRPHGSILTPHVDFKLCRSLLDSQKLRRKVESSGREGKIVRIRAETLKIFPSPSEKGTNGLSFFALEGKIEQRIRISARKRPRGPGLSKLQYPALTSSIGSCDKHLKSPPETTR